MECLPGGLWKGRRLRREFAFKPVIGTCELAISEIADSKASIPTKVTSVLSRTLQHVGGDEPSGELVGRLCVADRQFLMRRLAIEHGLDEIWLTAPCRHCHDPFDVRIVHSEMPIKPVGKGFPFVTVATKSGPRRFRVPNGDDQEWIAALDDVTAARRLLVHRCQDPSDDLASEEEATDDSLAPLTESDVELIEAEIESVSPEIAVLCCVVCPACGTKNDIVVDPYICLQSDLAAIYLDVNVLATVYHWSEAEILSLPRDRRRIYLSMADRARGMAS